MALILSKSYDTEKTYELSLGGLVLTSYKGDNLPEIISAATAVAKKYQKNLYLERSAAAHHFIGYEKGLKNPVIFKDEDFVTSNYKDKYTYVDGPYADLEEAQEACYVAVGSKGVFLE